MPTAVRPRRDQCIADDDEHPLAGIFGQQLLRRDRQPGGRVVEFDVAARSHAIHPVTRIFSMRCGVATAVAPATTRPMNDPRMASR